MSESALAFFLVTRDPDSVSREWSSADPVRVKREGMSKRDAGQSRLRELVDEFEGFDPPGCVNGHPLSERRYTLSSGRVQSWCRACKREAYRRRRDYRKAHAEKVPA